MYIDTSYSTQGNKTYCRHLLRESYRENGKVVHRTLGNVSHCSEEEINAIKLALKHKGNLSVLGSVKDIKTQQGLRLGAVICLQVVAERLGIIKALGNNREGKLALWQVMARLIDQGSRLSSVRLAESHAACDILGLDTFNEEHLYSNLAWLTKNQEAIEMDLFRNRYGSSPAQLFLYDVTSSYLEGVKNILAAFGYNRDGKKGKKQLVIGLLTAPDGTPVSVRVFTGNTQDTKTVAHQIRDLAQLFGVQEVTLVGDRGMLKHPQLELLGEKGFHYITAITKPQINKFLREGAFQISLFDEPLGEVEVDGVRYILHRNPKRAEEIAQNRLDKLASLQNLLAKENLYLQEHPRAKVEVAINKVAQQAKKLKVNEWVKVIFSQRIMQLTPDEQACQQQAQLDGCYVIKTDLTVEKATSQTIYDLYKDLSQVEHAFRTFKTGHLEIRPTFVRCEASTRGHVLVVMLAYLIERELYSYWRQLDNTVAEGIDELGSIRGVEISFPNADLVCQKVLTPTGLSEKLLQEAHIRLPDVLPLRKIHVATRKKLYQQRK
ncbi:MAG: IS1634 family transposase [Candidatus Desantisbacteria bacterium]